MLREGPHKDGSTETVCVCVFVSALVLKMSVNNDRGMTKVEKRELVNERQIECECTGRTDRCQTPLSVDHRDN